MNVRSRALASAAVQDDGLSAAANAIQETWGEDHSYLGKLVNNNFFFNWLTFFILYNNLIPISLQV